MIFQSWFPLTARQVFAPCFAVCLALASAHPAAAQSSTSESAARPFTIATWGGEYAEAQRRALFEPFATTEGLAFDIVDFPGDPAAIDYQIQSGRVFWDVVDLEQIDADQLCARGALEPLDPVLARLDPSDFLPRALGGCGLGNVVWSLGVAFDPAWFDDNTTPDAFTDFFDDQLTVPRSLARSPIGLLEFASLASGIAPADVYDSLSSSEGVALALDTLTGIKPTIAWHEDAFAAFEALESTNASMTLVPHILPARAVVEGGISMGFLWDRHLYQMDSFAIIRGASNKAVATKFMIDSGLPAYQGTMSTLTLYGPTNNKAHDFLSQSILPWMPHAPANRDGAMALDAQWWRDQAGQAAIAAFDRWQRGQ